VKKSSIPASLESNSWQVVHSKYEPEETAQMARKTSVLRGHLNAKTFLHMPSVYDPLGARLVEQTGFEAAYVGGYVTGRSQAITEPLLTMTEQANVAEAVASSIDIPVVADAGAGFGEPLHTMRTIREFIRAEIAGVHLEDQFFPKRAHYHKYQVHSVPTAEFVTNIRSGSPAARAMTPTRISSSSPAPILAASSGSRKPAAASTAPPTSAAILACCSRAIQRKPRKRRSSASCGWSM
jgi:isocitrate lyase